MAKDREPNDKISTLFCIFQAWGIERFPHLGPFAGIRTVRYVPLVFNSVRTAESEWMKGTAKNG
jgi:hypothetical protein